MPQDSSAFPGREDTHTRAAPACVRPFLTLTVTHLSRSVLTLQTRQFAQGHTSGSRVGCTLPRWSPLTSGGEFELDHGGSCTREARRCYTSRLSPPGQLVWRRFGAAEKGGGVLEPPEKAPPPGKKLLHPGRTEEEQNAFPRGLRAFRPLLGHFSTPQVVLGIRLGSAPPTSRLMMVLRPCG